MKTIALTGGGTAGHVMPNIALLPELKKKFDRIIYIGGNGMEKDIVSGYGIPFFETSTVKFSRQKPLSNLKIPLSLIKATIEAKKILQSEEVNIVFSKGGYASLPTCLGAKLLGIPIVTHESDYTMGLANKVISKFANQTLTSFPETKGGKYVGNPIRPELLCGNATAAKQKYDISDGKTILIFGGSSGAIAINDIVKNNIEKLTEKYNVIHIVGEKTILTGLPSIKKYRIIPYAVDIADLYALADICITRGGANSLQELYALKIPAVCIPLPKGNSRGDQELNAKSYQNKGSIVVLEQKDLTITNLMEGLEKASDITFEKDNTIDNTSLNIVNEICNFLT